MIEELVNSPLWVQTNMTFDGGVDIGYCHPLYPSIAPYLFSILAEYRGTNFFLLTAVESFSEIVVFSWRRGAQRRTPHGRSSVDNGVSNVARTVHESVHARHVSSLLRAVF